MENFVKYIKENSLGIINENVDLKKYNTLKIGGIGRILYFPTSITTLKMAFNYLLNHELPYYVIGNGSNLLINDRYIDCIFINLRYLNSYKILHKDRFFLESGIGAPSVATKLAKLGYTKIEFMSVIPGTIGGLVYMNAGAYKKAMSDIVESVIYLNEEGNLVIYQKKDLDFSYRHSIFQTKKGIIVGCIIKLTKAIEKQAPISRIKNYLLTKRMTQPIGFNNAGSTFRNNDAISAWKVIDSLGYRGKKLGGAKVSEKHANFLLNVDNATYQDMINLITLLKQEAKEKQNIDLICEWKILE